MSASTSTARLRFAATVPLLVFLLAAVYGSFLEAHETVGMRLEFGWWGGFVEVLKYWVYSLRFPLMLVTGTALLGLLVTPAALSAVTWVGAAVDAVCGLCLFVFVGFALLVAEFGVFAWALFLALVLLLQVPIVGCWRRSRRQRGEALGIVMKTDPLSEQLS